jgi:hypothetical protein
LFVQVTIVILVKSTLHHHLEPDLAALAGFACMRGIVVVAAQRYSIATLPPSG